MWAISAAASPGPDSEQDLPARHQQLVAQLKRLGEIRLRSALAHGRDGKTAQESESIAPPFAGAPE